MTATIEERLRRLEHREEIRDLLTAYGKLLDERDLAGYAALFARNGTWTGPYIGSAEGPAAIQALLEKNLGAVAGDDPAGAHHIMSNMAIEIEGDAAKAWSRWTYVVPGDARQPSIALSGHYDDVLTREGGRWRFKSRVVSGDLPGVGAS
jgi:3-phenylpropionate/cinnamic acid dioxygenase small subunit